MSGGGEAGWMRRALAIVPAVLVLALALASPAWGASRAQLQPAKVKSVQRLFHVLGYPLGKERAGRLGSRTKGALSYFQHKYRLPVTGYPDANTIAVMRAVAASLRAAPRRGAVPRDFVDRLLGDVPIMPLGLACALGLSLLALTARWRDTLPDR